MRNIDRRDVLRSASIMALIAPASMALGGRAIAQTASSSPSIDALKLAQKQDDEVWAFFRSFYGDKDNADVQGFISHFKKSPQTVYEDAVAGFGIPGYDAIAGSFTQYLGNVQSSLGKGQFSKLFHVAGDMRYGAVAEFVDLKGTFFSTNGFTLQSVIDFDDKLVARNTDYWDSRELGMADIAGPVGKVALPVGPAHKDGTPRKGTLQTPPGGPVQLAVGATGRPSASKELVSFVQEFHGALKSGKPQDIANFFTEDAVYVDPLLHQGDVGYANYNQGIQIRGRQLIAAFFQATSQLLPDGKDSSLVHIVGGPAGGGFEWKAGGAYKDTGVDRTGLVGCTSLNLFGNRISRMSVKFDTFHLSSQQYGDIQSAVKKAAVIG